MKRTINEKPETNAAVSEPRSKRYDEAFKKQAVENWLQSGKPGTQIARELGVSCPTLSPAWICGGCGQVKNQVGSTG